MYDEEGNQVWEESYDENGEPVYDETKTIDGHIIKTSATPPLRKWLSTPALPDEFVKHLPAVEDEDDPQ